MTKSECRMSKQIQMIKILLTLLLATSVLAADENKDEKAAANSSNEVAVIKTSEGDMVV